jgi:glycosyltransferase involved in cell wall biosynthesis
MSRDLVSVIVPAYNHARYVAAALDSVAAQTHADLELIVVDDFSSDGTAEAVERWRAASGAARRFGRVELVRHAANRGAHASLNDGMALARGEYLCFLNSDDCFAPTRIALLLERMRAQGARFAFSAVMPIDDAGRRALQSPLARRIATAGEEIALLPSTSFGFLYRQLAISTGNFLLERSLQGEVGEFKPLQYCHDWDFALRAFLRAEPLFVDEYLYLYRFHGANSFAGLQDVALRETVAVLREYYLRCLQELPLNDKAPAPANWPGVFEYFIDYFELSELWSAVCRQRGYAPPYRPARRGAPRLSRYRPAAAGDGVARALPAKWRKVLGLDLLARRSRTAS